MELCAYVCEHMKSGIVGGDGSAAIVIRHLIVVINETKTNGTMRIIIIVFISLFLLCARSKCRYIVFIYLSRN